MPHNEAVEVLVAMGAEVCHCGGELVIIGPSGERRNSRGERRCQDCWTTFIVKWAAWRQAHKQFPLIFPPEADSWWP